MAAEVLFVLSPFQIDDEFFLRVRATTEREELRGAGLVVRVGQPARTVTEQI
jgi:hypothetical protein